VSRITIGSFLFNENLGLFLVKLSVSNSGSVSSIGGLHLGKEQGLRFTLFPLDFIIFISNLGRGLIDDGLPIFCYLLNSKVTHLFFTLDCSDCCFSLHFYVKLGWADRAVSCNHWDLEGVCGNLGEYEWSLGEALLEGNCCPALLGYCGVTGLKYGAIWT
jgi:hypothetical protein